MGAGQHVSSCAVFNPQFVVGSNAIFRIIYKELSSHHAREKYTDVRVSENPGESCQGSRLFRQQRTGDGAGADAEPGRGKAASGLYQRGGTVA